MSSWPILWFVFSAVGIFLVYWMGMCIERRSPAMALAFLVMFGPGILVASGFAASQIAVGDNATCEELDPSADRLKGITPSEFRLRCIATQDNSQWLAWRRKL